MLSELHPLESASDFSRINEFIARNVNDQSANSFITSTLMRYPRDLIESITRSHKERGFEYLARLDDGAILAMANVIRSPLTGFELMILIVDKDLRGRGLGQLMLEEIVALAVEGGYRDVKTDVFVDNKAMLRLLIQNDFVITKLDAYLRADGMARVELKKRLST